MGRRSNPSTGRYAQRNSLWIVIIKISSDTRADCSIWQPNWAIFPKSAGTWAYHVIPFTVIKLRKTRAELKRSSMSAAANPISKIVWGDNGRSGCAVRCRVSGIWLGTNQQGVTQEGHLCFSIRCLYYMADSWSGRFQAASARVGGQIR